MTPPSTALALPEASFPLGPPLLTTKEEVAGVQELIDRGKSAATKRAYASDWRSFEAWCGARGAEPLPLAPVAVATYLRELFVEGLKVRTIMRAYAGLVFKHRTSGHDWRGSDLIDETLRGIRNTRAEMGETTTKKAAITREILLEIVSKLDLATLPGVRDHAVLTLGWTGCARRSEIAELLVGDIHFTPEGMVIRPRKTKTDQEGKDTEKGIPFARDRLLCATLAVQAWLAQSAIASGPLFRGFTLAGGLRDGAISGNSIAVIVKKAIRRAGIDPARFAGHSLRSGFITSAVHADVPEHVIATQSGHRSVATLRGYVRHANLFRKNAATGLV